MVAAEPKKADYASMTDRQLYTVAIAKWKNADKYTPKNCSLDYINRHGVHVNIFLSVTGENFDAAFEIIFKAGKAKVKTYQLISIVDAVNIAEDASLADVFEFSPNCDGQNINGVTPQKVAA